MAYKPILFNTEMVQAIMEERKTQTRRIIKDNSVCRPFEPGDILWVRETWGKFTECNVYPPYEPEEERFIYRADIGDPDHFQAKWRPSIHMTKEAARIFLRVKDVRVERLQDISVLDAINEGCCGTICDHADAHPALGCTDCYNTGWLEPPDAEFALLWDTTVKKANLPIYGWEANPWVWVIEFERCEKPERWC